MDKLLYTYLLIFCCLTFVYIDGRGQDSSCETDVMVRRGTTFKAVPKEPLRVKCRVKHCGESFKVTWCKLLKSDTCEQMNNTENIRINTNELMSYLTFARLSTHDDGLYRCKAKGYEYEMISHVITISVSDLNQRVTHPVNMHTDNKADELSNAAAAGDGDVDVPWPPYLIICISIALVVVTLTVLTLLNFYGLKRTLNHTKGQEMSTHMIPNIPIGSAPSTFVLHDTYSTSPAERPGSHPPLMTTGGNQPDAAHGGQVSGHAAYSVVNHPQSGMPAREPHAATKQNINAEYSSIIVS